MKRLIVLVLLLILCIPAMAQDATVEPTVEAGQVTVIDGEGGDTNITVEAPETPVTPVDNSPMGWIAVGLGALVAVLVSFSLALQVIGNRAQSISSDPSAVSLLERGYDTVLPDMVKTIAQPLKESLERSDSAVDKLLELLNKVTDGVPEASKQKAAPASAAPYGSFPDGKPLEYTSTSTTEVGVGSKPADSAAFPPAAHGS